MKVKNFHAHNVDQHLDGKEAFKDTKNLSIKISGFHDQMTKLASQTNDRMPYGIVLFTVCF